MNEPKPVNRIQEIARRNRAVADESWIRSFLHSAANCFLATAQEGQPSINANLFVYDEAAEVIYVHSAGGGSTHAAIAAGGRVCLAVAEMGRLLPGERVTDFSTEYASVIVWGHATVVTDPQEVRHALQSQLDKYFPHHLPGRDYAPFTDEESARAAVYRIAIEEWSAKEHQSAVDHPGAFWFAGGHFRRDGSPGTSSPGDSTGRRGRH